MENDPLYKLPQPGQNLTEDDVRRIVGDMLDSFDRPAKMTGSFFQSANFATGVQGWQLRPDGAEINGAFQVTQINIPDTTTANSFHVDSSGNAWWGANVATGYTGANAYVLSTGEAVFKNVQIGGTTIQYVITNSGIFSFGDGSDGDATCDGSTAVAGMSLAGSTYTMTRDVYFDSLTINTGITVKPAGYRIFVKDTLTLSGTAHIDGDGTAGTNGDNGYNKSGSATLVPVAGGASVSMADGYLKGSAATGAGGNGGSGDHGDGGIDGSAGSNGTNTSNSLGSNAVNGGAGGYGGILIASPSHGHPGAGGTGGTRTLSNVKLIANWHLATLLDVAASGTTVKFDNSASAAGGGGGAGGTTGTTGKGPGGGGGGAGGCSGRILAIYARTIVVGASASITANGGKGGDGGNGGDTADPQDYTAGGGGGGGGGNGGIIILVYNVLTNSGSITVTAGTKGLKGLKSVNSGGGTDNATDGNDGQDGAAGVIYQFQLSL